MFENKILISDIWCSSFSESVVNDGMGKWLYFHAVHFLIKDNQMGFALAGRETHDWSILLQIKM